MFDATELLKAVLALAIVIITAIVIPYIRSKTTAEERDEILFWVKIAVAAAEQVFTGPGRGEEKKEYVLNWLMTHDIVIDFESLDAMIESAVYEINNQFIAKK